MRLITCQRWHSPKKGKGNYCLFNVAVYHIDWHQIVCPKCKSPITNPDLARAAEVTGFSAGRISKLANICKPTKDPNRKWGQL